MIKIYTRTYTFILIIEVYKKYFNIQSWCYLINDFIRYVKECVRNIIKE